MTRLIRATGKLVGGICVGFLFNLLMVSVLLAGLWLLGRTDQFLGWYQNANLAERAPVAVTALGCNLPLAWAL